MAAEEFTAPIITVDAPSLGTGGERPAGGRPAPRPLAPRVVQQPVSAASPKRRRSTARALARKVTAGGALLFIGSLVVVTSLPAQAVRAPDTLDPAIAQIDGDAEAQTLGVADGNETFFARDDVAVNDLVAAARMSPGELAAFQSVADAEPGGSSYGGDPAFPQAWGMLETSYVQTPFPELDQLRITSPFGYRPGGFHGGTDIAPGLGTEIRPIANGVVSAVWQGNNPGGGGYTVFIDHNIDGEFFQSWYAHMVPGSIRVEVGQVVDITTVIGLVGSSGRSTGPHLHFEIKNGDYVSFDPMLWLQTREQNLEFR
ncbi:peptidoglycan DD-metalloendopeptidase family protein [Agrococcus sp. HG114]|uniref:peptidoglycan DD-metalloendopeptidase family protein n=1 Tax=Agrococcus sp. HG114 TaxID=2969757 RepID=UPI00215A6CE2|nr:peptidoglycan DD-metalloendopeptidase family protein [Agrococcus sp. HG114]MCR8670404.1 peptidoglycan DD-metalloendopeptidase family protein [Agrococcus sp. HG114]